MIYLITGKKCPKCQVVKMHIPRSFTNILDYESPEAKVILAANDMESLTLSLPLLIDDSNGTYISGDFEKIIDLICSEYE